MTCYPGIAIMSAYCLMIVMELIKKIEVILVANEQIPEIARLYW